MSAKLSDLELLHYGVKGMKWGVRKDRSSSGSSTSSERGTYKIHPDGKIEINPGVEISRVVRNTNGLFGGTGRDWASSHPVYAAFLPGDKAQYEHFFGRSKSLLVKEASTVLKLTPKEKLTAPGPKEAASIFYDLARKDPEFRQGLESGLNGFARRQLKSNIENPTSKRAHSDYALALDSANYSERFKGTNQKYFEALKKAGYNSLLDPSDAYGGFDAPIIVLDGKKSLELKHQYAVDKVSQERVRQAVKSTQYELGKTYLEKLGYA